MRQTILVVDDEPDILELIRLNLSQAGYRIETAMTGSEALGLLERSAPDLVVLDLGLKDAPSTKVVEILRSLSPDLKIIAVTGESLADGRDELEGTVGLLYKPVRSDRLVALVGRALGRNMNLRRRQTDQ